MILSGNINRLFILLFLLLALTVPRSVDAQTVTRVDDLYSFEVVVADTSPAERKSGLIKALEQVMVRVTGDKRIATHPDVGGLFSQVENFLQRYGYSQRRKEPEEDDRDSRTDEAQGVFAQREKAVMQTVLSGSFEPVVLENALREAGLPVWDRRRPRVLILSSVDGREQVRAAGDADIRPVLESASALRGLPIRIPDDPGLDTRNIWKGDRFAMEDAAQVAGVDYVHWSRIVREDTTAQSEEDDEAVNWVVDAALYQRGELVREWYFNAPGEEAALRRMIDELTDWMAGRYAVVTRVGGQSVIGLHIGGVDDVGKYASVQSLLAQQGALEFIELVAVGGDSLVYRVTTRSDPRQLEYSLGLLRQLVEGSASEQTMQVPIWLGELQLHYRLQE